MIINFSIAKDFSSTHVHASLPVVISHFTFTCCRITSSGRVAFFARMTSLPNWRIVLPHSFPLVLCGTLRRMSFAPYTSCIASRRFCIKPVPEKRWKHRKLIKTLQLNCKERRINDQRNVKSCML